MESLEIKLEIVVLVHQDNCLFDVIAPLCLRCSCCGVCDLDDPRELGLEARDWLIRYPLPADLNLYLEDDLVIYDDLFFIRFYGWLSIPTIDVCFCRTGKS